MRKLNIVSWFKNHLVVTTLLTLAILFALYELVSGVFVFSRDAYITTNVIGLAPQVSGPLAELNVKDNQIVYAEDVVIKINPEPFRLDLDRVQASYDLAKANGRSTISDDWRNFDCLNSDSLVTVLPALASANYCFVVSRAGPRRSIDAFPRFAADSGLPRGRHIRLMRNLAGYGILSALVPDVDRRHFPICYFAPWRLAVGVRGNPRRGRLHTGAHYRGGSAGLDPAGP